MHHVRFFSTTQILGPQKFEGWTILFNTTAAGMTWMQPYHVVSKSIGFFFCFIAPVLLWFQSQKFRLPYNPPVREQTFISGTELTSLFFILFTQSNTLDEFRNDFYIINFYVLWNFPKISCLMQLKLFQLQTRYQSADIWMIFTLPTKTIHTTYSRSKCTLHNMQ